METIEAKKHKYIRAARKPKSAKKIVPLLALPAPAQEPKFILIEKGNRHSDLVEGRTIGVGYAMLKRNGDTFTTLYPISACKDYPNDTIFSEHTGKTVTNYGYTSSPCGCFDKDYAYCATTVLPRFKKESEKKATHDQELKYLAENQANLLAFINKLEEMLKLQNFTKIYKCDQKDKYIIFIPTFWVKYSYLISIYLLLFRFVVEHEYIEGDIFEAMDRCKSQDANMIANTKPKILAMIKGKIPVQNWVNFSHGFGIEYMHHTEFGGKYNPVSGKYDY